MSRDPALAEVGPPPQAQRPPRQPSALRGKIWIASDFDPLPANALAAMEGRDE
jgi:hypothetical protein